MLSRRDLQAAVAALALSLGCGSPPPPEVPETVSPEPEESASSSELAEGEQAIGAGDFARAETIFAKLSADEPQNARAHFYLGVAQQNLGKNAEAVQSYQKAVDLAPKLAEAWVNLTAAMLDAGDAAGALPVIERGLGQHPDNAALLYNRALALGARGPGAETVAAYRAALEADPANIEIKYGYAEALVAAGSNEQAEKLLAELAQSDSIEVLASTARLYGRLEKFDACITALDKAIGQKQSSELYVARGLCQHGKKDEEAAFKDFQLAVKADGSYAPGHYYAGMHLKMKGKKAEAKNALKRAHELAGDQGVGKAAQRALESL
jgi:tetratricopeptide (TPR) repeat protein